MMIVNERDEALEGVEEEQGYLEKSLNVTWKTMELQKFYCKLQLPKTKRSEK